MSIRAHASASQSVQDEALNAGDDIFKLALEASLTDILITTPSGQIMFTNRTLGERFGYAKEELIGQSIELLLPDSLRTLHVAHRSRYLDEPSGRPTGVTRELLGRHKDGSHISVEIALNVMQGKAGLLVLVSVVDIKERPRREQEHQWVMDDRIAFERLVGEVSASFINVTAEKIDQAIVDALAQISATLNLDRGTVFSIAHSGNEFVTTHHWQRPGQRLLPKSVAAEDHFPWSLEKICNGEPACFSSIDEVPNAIERESLQVYDTKSRVAIPLRIGGQVVGAIAFASTREERQWPEEILSRLRLVSQVFAGALARREAELAVQASEERFRILADNAPVMIWVSGNDKACTWFNRRWLDFVGRTMEEEVGDGWTKAVHPDDLDSCLKVYTNSFDARQPFNMEYRLRRHDGTWRWILDQGIPNYAANADFRGFIGSCIDVTDEKSSKQQLEHALVEVRRLRDQLQAENVYLRREVQDHLDPNAVVGRSAAIRRVLELVEQVAATDSTVLLLGETGAGKELFATQIHELSARHNRTMVRVNCAAIPTTLIESELFGRERGAYTGALTRQIGRFELADHSTIFLDEIGDLPLEVQIKLLRVLEERQFERLGSAKGIHVDVRIIAATHRNLEQQITDGAFREDLFYRLNVFPIHVPSLRERVDDIPLLVWRFVEEVSKAFGKRIETISSENMGALQEYSWPGNIRELRNVVERAMIGATGTRLTIALPAPSANAKKHFVALNDVEREHIRSVLENTRWRIRGTNGAAVRLGLKPTTLETRMAKLGLSRPKQI